METLLFKTAYAFYTLSTLLYLGYLLVKKQTLSRWAFGALVLAVLLHAGSFATRTVAARQMVAERAQAVAMDGQTRTAPGAGEAAGWYVPWSNWFESLSFFGAVIALIYLVIAWNSPIPILGSFIMMISWSLLTGSLLRGASLHAHEAVLQSRWMSLHIPLMFAAYSLLSIAFAVALAYLIEERQMKRKRPTAISFQLPSLDHLDRMMHRLVALAVPTLGAGLVFGALWAHEAWGRYWGWDPKETSALVTWLLYVFFLMARKLMRWRGRKLAYLSVAGFISILFTFIGVNFLSPLHGFLSAGR